MKAIIVSDTHKERESIENIVKFAKANDIKIVLDAGDLHGAIKAYEGIEELHTTYWEKASSTMERWEFNRDVREVGGTVHENGSTFKLDDVVIFTQHNLAEYEQELPRDKLEMAIDELDHVAKQYAQESQEKDLKKLIIFGHTHSRHLTKQDDVIAVNPGWAAQGMFAVIDTDEGSVEYMDVMRGQKKARSVMKIDKDSDITHFRKFDFGSYIAGLKTGKEVFVFTNKDKKEVRTEEFKKVISGSNTDKGLELKIENDDNLQQLIRGDFRSKTYKKIGKSFDEYDKKGNRTGMFTGYVATKEIDGKDKKVLVIGPEETESIPFDKFKEYSTPIIQKDLVCFVGQSVTEDEDGEEETTDQLVWNNKVIASYKSIDNTNHTQGRLFIKASAGRKKQFIAEIGPRGGVHRGKKYDSVSNVELLEDKVVYTAKEKNQMFVVIDKQEQVKYESKGWKDKIEDIQFIGGKLTYKVSQDGKDMVVFDEKESQKVSSEGYGDSGIKELQDLQGKPAYITKVEEGNDQIIVNGKVRVEAETIDDFLSIGDKIIYQKGKYGSGDCFWEDGTKIEEEDSVHRIRSLYEKGKFKLPEK